MSTEDGDYPAIGRSPATNETASRDVRLQQQCRQCAETHLRGYIKQVFGKADDLLFERSNSGAADAAGYFDALRELRLRRGEIERRFHENFAKSYDARLRQGPSVGRKREAPQGLGLSLIDEKELEESLAIEGLVGKAKERFRTPLYALTQRYQRIGGGAIIDEDTHPLAPDVICHAFRDAFEGIGLHLPIKLILYKLFEQHTLKELGVLYEGVNVLLMDTGILPQLKGAAPVRTNSGGDTAATAVATPGRALPLSPSAASHTAPGEGRADVYQTLQHLMNLKKFGAPPSQDVQGGELPFGDTVGSVAGGYGAGYFPVAGPPLPAADLVQGLSLLQHLPPPDPQTGASGIAYIKSTLLQQLGDAAAGKAIDPVHDNTIDVIGMIFEFILDEPSIPEIVKRLLNQLQIPILKVAIVDKEFFTHKQHPARRLLNTLGHASIGWNDKDEATQQRRYEKMEYVVERVLKEYQTDPGIFAELLDVFTVFLAGEGDEELPDDKFTASAAEDQAASPEQRAFEAIELRLDEVELPRNVRDFLRSTWQRVMLQVAAQEGIEGETWKRRYQTLEDLLWSMEPKKTREDQRRMVALLPRLLGALQDGMRSLDCSQAEIDEVLNGLQPIHMACLRGEAPPAGVVPPATRESAPASQEVTALIRSLQQDMASNASADDAALGGADDFELKLNESFGDGVGVDDALGFDEETIDDEFSEQARNLALGTWLEFVQGSKGRRAKLGWKSAVLGQYVFVDRRYKVVAEKTLHELAADLREGRVHVVTNIGMFDRALDKVLNGLMAGAAVR